MHSCPNTERRVRRVVSHGAALVALTILSACHFAPPHARPALPTPLAYEPSLDSAGATGARAIDIGWGDFFRDPRLDALIAAALEHNRDLRISVARIEQARGAYRIQGADRFPTPVASAGATRSHAGELASGIPGAGDRTVDRASVNVGVSSFELDFWGRVRDLTESARADYLATVQAQRAFRLSLIQDVAATYLASIETAEQIRLADTTVQSRREGVRIAQVRQRAGLTSALDLHQSESLLAQAEAALAGLRLTQVQVNSQLAVLVGGPVATTLPSSLPLEAQMSPAVLSAGLPSELLLLRPDVLAAEERLRSAEASIGAARAAFFPSISLTGALGFASSALNTLVGNDGLSWSYGPSIAAPIFNRGRIRGNVQIARAQGEIALADYERTIQVAFQEVTNALAGRRFLADQVAAQERGTIAQRQIAQLARTRYLEGVVSYIEVLDAERNLFAAEQQLLRLRRANVENLVSLYVALGGGVIERR
ncbi:MAG TPA: efflux transporter outer membrane subunit [Gemmatimonadaceae bacterium]|nr:efflux transporter outer membrane subunit [Gemmatimonadaceae bacterium]